MGAEIARQVQDPVRAREVREPVRAPFLRARSAPKSSSLDQRAAPFAETRPADRRSGIRRLERRSVLPLNWSRMAAAFGIGGVVVGLAAGVWPGPIEVALWLASTLIAFASPYVGAWEVQRHASARLSTGVIAVVVGLPMLTFGLMVAGWTHRNDVASWDATIGVPIIVSSIAAVILNRNVPSIISALVCLWAGVATGSGSIETWIILAIGAASGIYASLRQLKDDKIAEERRQERRRTQERAQEILNEYELTGQGWFWETDRRGLINYVSPTVSQALGCHPDDLLGRAFVELFDLHAEGSMSERTLTFHLSARSPFSELVVRAASRDEERWWSINGRPMFDSFNNFMGFRGSGTDLTAKRRSEEHASQLAHYDSLTSLANRFQMSQTLEKILTAQRLEHRACAVFLLDLDRFKQVNDTLGHPAGDALLKQVAERLEATIGKHGRVGRLGGDEFQVILPGKNSREDLGVLCQRVIDGLSQPYSIEGHRVTIGVSIGIALSPDDGVTSEALIRNADLALYAAKDGGRGRYHFYASDLHSDAEERRMLEQDLRDAVVNGDLELHYQPVVQTVTERITGFEALLRWTHPAHGPISPAKFIPIAEDAGLIAQIGEWALRRACSDLALWPESVRVAVNVSPLQFANPSLPAIVTNALAHAQVDPARLELEITESVFLNDDAGTDAMFAALKRVGVRLALDDFGTGYSSLGYLKKAPFDKIKIDQSFVRGATQPGSRNGALISSIVSLAEALGMETTAEGVETLDELDLVRMLGCSHIQGYIYAKSMPLDAVQARLAQGLTLDAIGPRSARAARQTVLRKVTLDHGGQNYYATIRNMSATGAMVEGLWNVPKGTIFQIDFGDGQFVTATARWCQEDRMGVEFASSLPLDATGKIAQLTSANERRAVPSVLRSNG
jgi:diguanylate cyclase (GGDEF)-like protein/PAS domain S-box-containing protein